MLPIQWKETAPDRGRLLQKTFIHAMAPLACAGAPLQAVAQQKRILRADCNDKAAAEQETRSPICNFEMFGTRLNRETTCNLTHWGQ